MTTVGERAAEVKRVSNIEHANATRIFIFIITMDSFAPPFAPNEYSSNDKRYGAPFFTNMDKSVYAPLIFSPELIGALCSRASRASHDLRRIFLDEYIYPFAHPVRDEKDTDETYAEKIRYGEALKEFITFLHLHPPRELFSNPRARSFYTKWLAQYGDDSIAQMAGMHLVYSSLSQVAIKHLEDQRIGLAPIEKSTRYVNYGQKVGGQYLYYTDPTLADLNLESAYRRAMDGLFETYSLLIPQLTEWLRKKFPEEKPSVVEKKALDTLRGLLPTSTLSQVAFFGNGQAFEYMVSRCLRHPLGEIRWAGERAYEELNTIAPAFLRRIKQEEGRETAVAYQKYMAGRGKRVAPFVREFFRGEPFGATREARVRLVEYDPKGEDKVITGMLYAAPNNHRAWDDILARVLRMNDNQKRIIIAKYLGGRTARWQKVGRAFENAYVRFEIVMNIGAWRDLHRHRMLTQQRQHFSCFHGYDVPPEVTESGLEPLYRAAITPVEDMFAKLVVRNPDLAQYAATLAHRVRFMQWQNLREVFWETELRTIPEGHPDYRHIEQQKFRCIEKIYPLIAEHIRVNMGEYDFARRGQEEKIQKKLQSLS